MTKNAARLEKMIEAVEAGLAELDQATTPLGQAVWYEADANAGYLIHRDGRMMPVGEYQYGFSSVEEMKAAAMGEDESTEEARSARNEIGRIASALEPFGASADMDDLAESIIYSFMAEHDQQIVRTALEDNGMSALEVFDLYTTRPKSRNTTYAPSLSSEQVKLDRDLEVAMLKTGEDGQPQWSVETLARAGETLTGSPHDYSNPLDGASVAVTHPVFGKLGVMLEKGDYTPGPQRIVSCGGPRP